jgi:hypothetical protein
MNKEEGEILIRRSFVVLSLGLLVACDGVIGSGGGVRVGGDDPTTPASPSYGYASQASLLRLTKGQHQRTLQDLLRHFLGAEAQAVLDEVEPVYGIIPDDPVELNFSGLVGSTFSRMSQNVGELHARGYYDVATAAAGAIVNDDGRRTRLFGDCVDSPASDHSSCIGAFVDSFGLWAMRRPLYESERDFFLNEVFADGATNYEATPQALSDLLVAFLLAPNFLYRIEVEGEEIGDGLFALDAYGLASRLSFHFWGSMPDEALLDAAEDGSLLTESGYAAVVERVYADPRAQETFARFFFEWLELYKAGDPFGGVTPDNAQKMAFIEGYDISPTLRESMIDEVLEMTEYYRQNGVFEDLFTSPASFARTSDLAAIYDVPAWDGSEPLVEFPSPERRGLLGRAALLTAATVYTHPILRGVRVRENFMCGALGMPPANVNEGVEDIVGTVTTRERIDSLTSNGSCAGCHQMINGLGFPLEAFDALGRHREEEMVIDVDGTVTMLPLDLEATPFIDGLNDSRSVGGPSDLADALLQGGKLEECFARHYVRFALGLLADPSQGGDPGTISALSSELSAGAPLSEVFKGIAFLPAFKQRLKGDES